MFDTRKSHRSDTLDCPSRLILCVVQHTILYFVQVDLHSKENLILQFLWWCSSDFSNDPRPILCIGSINAQYGGRYVVI